MLHTQRTITPKKGNVLAPIFTLKHTKHGTECTKKQYWWDIRLFSLLVADKTRPTIQCRYVVWSWIGSVTILVLKMVVGRCHYFENFGGSIGALGRVRHSMYRVNDTHSRQHNQHSTWQYVTEQDMWRDIRWTASICQEQPHRSLQSAPVCATGQANNENHTV